MVQRFRFLAINIVQEKYTGQRSSQQCYNVIADYIAINEKILCENS